MTLRFVVAIACAIAAVPVHAGGSGQLALESARVSLDGTSSLHPYSASTTTVRLVNAELAGESLDAALRAGALKAFDIAIPVATLTSPREGIDKNMHKSLASSRHPDITFRLTTLMALEPAGPDGQPLRAAGVLTIAGTAREVILDLKARQNGQQMTVSGTIDLVMTDYGIKPPTAMLGMLKTDPKVTVTFEIVLTTPSAG